MKALNGSDHWPFYSASEEIERRFDLSVGAAEKMLREACASEGVRSYKEPYSMEGFEPRGEGPRVEIVPSEWRATEIDMATDANGCRYWVYVSEADFRYWLKPKATKQRTGKVPRIILHLAQLYPGGVPVAGEAPRTIMKADLLRRDPTLAPLDEATLKAAVDEYNADPHRRADPKRS